LDIPLSDGIGLPAKLLEYTRLLEKKVKAQGDEIEHVREGRDDALRIVDEQLEKISSLEVKAQTIPLHNEPRAHEEKSKLKQEFKVWSAEVEALRIEHAQIGDELRKNHDATTKLRACADSLSIQASEPLAILADLSKKINPSSYGLAPLEQLLFLTEYIDDLNLRVRDLHEVCENLENQIAEMQTNSVAAAPEDSTEADTEDIDAIEDVVTITAEDIACDRLEPETYEPYIKQAPIEEKYKRAQQRVQVMERRLKQKDELLRNAIRRAEELEKKNVAKQQKLVEIKARAEGLEMSLKQKMEDSNEMDKKWQKTIYNMHMRLQAEMRRNNT